jgi:hypothetical protein
LNMSVIIPLFWDSLSSFWSKISLTTKSVR